jgi:hypothetical protein
MTQATTIASVVERNHLFAATRARQIFAANVPSRPRSSATATAGSSTP